MDKKTLSDVMRHLGKKGGPARAKALSAERREEIAREAGKKGALARWKKQGGKKKK